MEQTTARIQILTTEVRKRSTTIMSWHKQKHYDPMEAFLQNERHQKVLNLQLEKIDKLWLHQLRLYARDRLETTSELIRLEDEKSQLAYFDESMDPKQMKEYTDTCLTHMKALKREMSHDNFNFDNTGALAAKQVAKQPLSLPSVDQVGYIVTQSLNKTNSKKRPNKAYLRKRRKSNLFKSKILSVSDSNLDMISKYKRENSGINISDQEDAKSDKRGITTSRNDKITSSSGSTTSLPAITPRSVIKTKDQHRYLKEKMATALVLPTVTEVNNTRQRKLSI